MYRLAYFYEDGGFDWSGPPCHTFDECVVNIRSGYTVMPYFENHPSFETIAERYWQAASAPAPPARYEEFLQRHGSNLTTRSVQQAVDRLNNFLSST